MNASPSSVKTRKLALLLFLLAAAGAALTLPGTIGSQTARAAADQKTTTTDNSGVPYDITTLAGKVASVNGTAGLQIRFSAFIEQESDLSDLISSPASGPITPFQILSSPLDGTGVLAPDVTVNLDTGGAPQNETAIAVDPNNSSRIVAAANDYVTLTWNCSIGAIPCSAVGDGYSGTYFSNDGGKTWCCASKLDGTSLGTLIPGVEHLTGGPYDAGGDPAVAFDSRGNVYYSGLGFDRTSPANTVAVNKGTFDNNGNLTWGAPVFINQTKAPSTANDKEWIAVDSHAASPFRDNVYVTWTRFIFNPHNGHYVQSPIAVAVSRDGGHTFSDPQLIVGNVLYGQGSRPVVGPDGTVYVFWDAATRLATFDSIWVVKSTDGGRNWSKPVAVSPLVDIVPAANTSFRVNSFPAAGVAPNGDLYVAWSSMMSNSGGLCPTRTATGYPVTQPDGSTLNAPAARRVDTLFPAVSVSPTGRVYMSAYAADVVSPWQTCAAFGAPSLNGASCKTLGPFINNARLDYVVRDLTSGVTNTVTTQPINTRYGFRGTFFGDYTDIAAGADDVFHAFWTDSNNVQNFVWFGGVQWVAGTASHQQDVVVRSDSF